MPTLSLVDESRKLGNFYVPRFEIVVGGTRLPDVVLRDVTPRKSRSRRRRR